MKWLEKNNINYQFTDIVKEPPSKEFLELALLQFSFDIKKIFNTRGKSFKEIDFDIFDLTKKEIIELAENILAQNAPKASLKLVEVMDSTDPIPQANVRLQAAQTLLDRVGLAKTDKLDVNLQTNNGLFILPAKQEVVIEGQYEEA